MKKLLTFILAGVLLTSLVGCSNVNNTSNQYDSLEVYDGEFVGFTFLSHYQGYYFFNTECFYENGNNISIKNMDELSDFLEPYKLKEENNDVESPDGEYTDARNLVDEWPLEKKLSLASSTSSIYLKNDLTQGDIQTIEDYIKTYEFEVVFYDDEDGMLKSHLKQPTKFTYIDLVEVDG